MAVKDSDTLKSYFNLTKVPTPSQYVDLVDTIFAQGIGEGSHDHDDRYVQLAIADIISAVHTFAPSVYGSPFFLGWNAQGQTVVGLKADQLNKSVIAGNGLSDGGELSSDIILNVGAGDGITVSANAVGLTTPGTLSFSSINNPSANHTHAITTSSNPGIAASILASDSAGRLFVRSKEVLGYTDYASLRNSFWYKTGLFIPEFYDAFVKADVRFNVNITGDYDSVTLPNLFNGNWDDTGLIVGDESHTCIITIDLIGKGEPLLVYGQGIFFITPYYLYGPSSVSARVHNYNTNTWQNCPVAINIQDTVELWQIGPYLENFIDIIEFTFVGRTNPSDLNGWVTEIEWWRTRPEQSFTPVVNLYNDIQFWTNLSMRDSTNTTVASLSTSGTGFFTKVGIAKASPDYDLDVNGTAQITGIRTDSITDKAGNNLILNPTGDITLDPGGNDVLPYTNYETNLGTLNKKYLALYAAELWVETLVAQNTLATIGGRILIGPTDTLTQNLASGSTTLHSKYQQMSVGDYVYMEVFDGGVAKIEWMKVTDGPNSEMGGYYYTVSRNLDRTGANDWYAGDAVFNTGSVGGGYMDLYSTFSTRSGNGPAIQGIYRYGDAYNYTAEAWAIGNLNGLYGYSSTTMGVGLGLYGWGYTYVTMDNSNGLRMNRLESGNGNYHQMARWYADGTILIGEVGSSLDNIYISAGAIDFRVNTTSYINMTNAGLITVGLGSGPNTLIQSTGIQLKNSSTVYVDMTSAGVITVGSASVGNVYISGSGIALRYGSTTYINLDTSGNALFGRTGGSYANVYWNVSNDRLEFRTNASVKSYIDIDGALVVYTTSDYWARAEAITWNNGSADIATLGAYDSEFLQGVELKTIGVAGKVSSAYLMGISLSTTTATATVKAANDSYSGYMTITAGSAYVSANLTVDKTYIGSNTRASELWITGNLTRWMPSGLSYVGYIFVPLTNNLTSTSWDGDSYSTTSKTLIDLSAVFGAPAGIKAVLMRVSGRDSGSAAATTTCYFTLGPTNVGAEGVALKLAGIANDAIHDEQLIVPCDSNGDIYYQISATGSLTMDIWLQIVGYWI